MRSRMFLIAVFVLAFSLTIIPTANAYIDPGSGSFIVQMLVGAALGAGVALKVFWRRIVSLFSGRNKKSAEGDTQGSE